MPPPVLSCTGLRKSFEFLAVPSGLLQDRFVRWRDFRRRRTIEAVRGVSLAVHPGEWVGLYGANGSGKTTVLRMLAGLLPPDAGHVERRGSLSCFFDLGVGFHPERCARENAYFHGLLHGLHPDRIAPLLPRILAFSGLEEHADLPFKCYSAGMKMRLAFACIAHMESEVTLWDEVASVGDAAFQRQCADHLHALKARGSAAVMVGHSLSSLRQSCDRILCMEDGVLVAEEVVRAAVPAARPAAAAAA